MPSSNTPAVNETEIYGRFPTKLISQRASSIQATSLISATSTAFGTQQANFCVEVANTLIALGIWKGAA